MQDYIDLAEKNGVTLLKEGPCQFCGAETQGGIHECMEIFNLGFQSVDFSKPENHKYRFFIVDAHTMQHPEIHGRWNNHFHLSRLHLILHYQVKWNYALSPKLSDVLNAYKANHTNEVLSPPPLGKRGNITSTDIQRLANNETACKHEIVNWASEVYQAWRDHHSTIELLAQDFLKKHNFF